MALWKNFPYSNTHELNMDWIAERVKEYVDKTDAMEISFADLKTYVENYFDNLDIQTEVDNKLEEMYENGELANLIAQFLTTETLLVFNTVGNLKAANNLTNGISVLTLGVTSYNDGDTRLYKIRPLTTGDVVDGDNIVALNNYPSLVGEKLKLKGAERKYLFIGDSYLQGWSDELGTIDNFGNIFKTKMGLTENVDYFHNELGGTGFGAVSQGKNFKNLLEDLTGQLTNKQKQDITDIIVAGCRNDAGATASAISSGLSSFISYATTNYPNATIHIGVVGWSRSSAVINQINGTVMPTIVNGIKSYKNVRYMNNIETTLIDKTLIDNVGNHPNVAGQNAIADNIICYLNTGYVSMFKNRFSTFTMDSNITYTSNGFRETFFDNMITFDIYGGFMKFENAVTIGNNFVDLLTLHDDFVFGCTDLRVPCNLIIKNNDGTYQTVSAQLHIQDSVLKVKIWDIVTSGNNYLSLSVKEIQFPQLKVNISAVAQY